MMTKEQTDGYNKKTSVRALKTVAPSKPLPQRVGAKYITISAKPAKHESSDELISEKFTALSSVVSLFETTVEMLVQKAESVAHHI